MSAIQQLLTDHIDLWTAAETGKKSGRGRAAGSAASVYGIKKLRELILELAVRGKLVPQDDDDEPASELLKRIQIEKAKLVHEGKIKKTKPLTALTAEESFAKLPQSWVKTRLANIANILNGRAYKKEELLDAGTPVLRVGNLFTSDHWYYSDLVLDDDKYCKEDDLLFAWSASFGPFIWDGEKSIYHYHIWKLDLYGDDPIYKRYLYIFLLEQTQKIKAAGHGVMMTHMTKEKMEQLVVYLPPASEQRRIVAKVDELMALCDQLEVQHSGAADAHEQLVSHLLGTLTQSQSAADFNTNWQRIAAHFDTLFTTEASIDALKQTLLQLAVMGKLVAQDANDEPASELLKQIHAEKSKLISEGKIKKEKLLAVIGADELRYSAPTGWGWVRFGVVAQTRLGKMLDQAKNKGSYRPYLRNTNVQWNRFELDDLNEMRFENHELDEYRLKAGDLVICEGGEPGRSAVWENQLEDMFIQKALHRARTWPGVSPHYLNIHLKVDVENGYLEKFFTGATIKHFSGEKLSSYPVALPPASEQLRILARLNELMALCDQVRSRITDANQQQKKLADVLVEHAVMG